MNLLTLLKICILKGLINMRKVKLRLCITIIALVMLSSITTYASEVFYWNGIEIQDYDDEFTVLPSNVTRSQGQTRGDYISTGFIDITNLGKGKASLTIKKRLLMYALIEYVIQFHLQKWNESSGDWEQVLRYDFESQQEDNPDEELIALVNGIDVENLQEGIYRARGLHAVYLGDIYERFASKRQTEYRLQNIR